MPVAATRRVLRWRRGFLGDGAGHSGPTPCDIRGTSTTRTPERPLPGEERRAGVRRVIECHREQAVCADMGGVERGDDGRIATSVLWDGAARSPRLGGSGLHLGIDLLVAAVPTLHLHRSFRAFLDPGQPISHGTTNGG